MGDLSCDSERVRMEGHDISFICEDDPVLLEEALPAGKTLFSCGELHRSQDGTHQQCMNGDSVETEVDFSGSPSSGTTRGKEGDGNYQSHVVSEYSEPKESSSYEPSTSFMFYPLLTSIIDPPGSWVRPHTRPSSPDDFGELEPELLDYDIGGSQESRTSSGSARVILDEASSSHRACSYSPKMSFPAAEAS